MKQTEDRDFIHAMVEHIVSAINGIAHGDTSAPGGLEAVAMAIEKVAESIDMLSGIGEALENVAKAIKSAADALHNANDKMD